MMKAIIYAAAALLILQIGLTVAVHQQQATNLESTAPDSAFLSFAPDSISSILIKGSENKELVLQKSDNGWIMPGAFSASASTRQVDDLLQKLTDARQGLAVATSKGAAQRFKTAEDDFERHVILKQGDSVVGDIYLGTSAGMRNSHVRKAGEDIVVSIPVGSHEVDVEADSWLDRTLADLNKDELKAVALGDISLSRKEEDKKMVWLLDGATKEETESTEVDSLLNKVTAISVQSVLDPATSAELFTKDPAVQFTVTKQDDSTVTYAFAKKDDKEDNKEDEYFVLKMSNNELYFKVGKWLVEGLAEMKREKLLVGYEEKKEETPAVQPAVQPAVPIPEQEAPQADVPDQEGYPVPEQETEQETEQEPDQEVLPDFLAEEDDEVVPVQEAVQEEDLKDEPVDSAESVESVESVQDAESAEQEQVETEVATEPAAPEPDVEAEVPAESETPAETVEQSASEPVPAEGSEQEQKQEVVPAEEAAE
ncbi:MAG: DUF4340 domain-containing protein [Candidatus Electrothrix sp. Rat3]|nr:DUF4340 domain-containing protein [Candidatus Electrothrix rattekaaiensis]